MKKPSSQFSEFVMVGERYQGLVTWVIPSRMMFCADCGNKLYQVRGKGWEHEKEYFVCATYRKVKGSSCYAFPINKCNCRLCTKHKIFDRRSVVAYNCKYFNM